MHPDELAAAVTALESIGWRAASDAPAEEIAGELVSIFSVGMPAGRASATLRHDVAAFLRSHSHPMDGSLSPVSAWEPAATMVIASWMARDSR